MRISFRGVRPRPGTRGVAAAAAALAGVVGVFAAAMPGAASIAGTTAARSEGPGCHLGNGITHVVNITWDNTHFFRDNPNVPSDLQMMPNLLNFIEGNGVMLSNTHTPLIAHTGDDLLTTATGLYGDRHGMPISNSYRIFNPSGTTDPAGSFAYWTDPVYDTASAPAAGHDINPSMVYSKVPPATAKPAPAPSAITPAPWVPYTRAGCDVGQVGTANTVLENTAVDIPKVFGAGSPEAAQVAADSTTYKDPESADYIGVGVHCAKGSAFCATAQGVKYGQTTATGTAVADPLPGEPAGYTGYQALFGHRYVAPQLGAGTVSLSRNGYQVTNAAGNLVDLNGNQINGAFMSTPGFPGFSNINAAQTLSYMSDMLESGLPVVNGYISDLHGNEHIPGIGGACAGAPSALGPGSACYIAQAQYYNDAFGKFFQRLAADGITAKNTLFVISNDEGDHVAGANVGRAIQPTPANCDGAKVSGTTVTADVLCTYPAGSFGELAGNLTGLLATLAGDTTPFTVEADTAPEFYVTGNPSAISAGVRSLEKHVAGLTASNPYTGGVQPITNYLADPTEQAILHMVNADPVRTPTFAMFARPDYYLSTGASTCAVSCVTQSTAYAYDHGDYALEINTTWVGIAGPGVKSLGVDGPAPAAGPNSAGPNSGQGTVPGNDTVGTWVDETDVRPTTLYLLGLRDDYLSDGRVITQILGHASPALRARGVAELGACYKQLNSSVGKFGTGTLIAATRAIESTSPGDAKYLSMNAKLRTLEIARDKLAGQIKAELAAAEFAGRPVHGADGQIEACHALIEAAGELSG